MPSSSRDIPGAFKLPSGMTIATFLAIIMLLGCGWYMMGPGGDGVVSSLKLSDGTVCVVTQQWNGWEKFDQPYTVNFYYRRPDGPWGWCPISDKANRWRPSAMSFDPGTGIVTIYNGNLKHAELNLYTSRFILLNREQGVAGEVEAPQGYKIPPFLPTAL